jgi:hypothetical protein
MRQEELEKERKNIYLTIKTLNIIIGILIAIIIFTILKNTALLFDQKSLASLFEKQQNATSQIFAPTLKVLLISFTALIILISINQRLKRTIKEKISKTIYTSRFKEKNANFEHERGLTFKEVISSKLFQYPNRFESNNLIEGEILGFPYKASNITLWKRYKKKGGDVEETVIFDGRMYVIKTPFSKKGIILKSKNSKESPLNIAILAIIGSIIFLSIITIIIPKILPALFMHSSPSPYQEQLSTTTLQQNIKFALLFVITVIILVLISLISTKKKKYQKAKLESSQFNKYFDIETQDQIELRKTLTPAVMEKLINLRNSIGEFHLSIIGNKIFFAFPKSFDIKYNKPIQELIEEAKQSVERELENIKSIIETLKLEEEKIKKGMMS